MQITFPCEDFATETLRKLDAQETQRNYRGGILLSKLCRTVRKTELIKRRRKRDAVKGVFVLHVK